LPAGRPISLALGGRGSRGPSVAADNDELCSVAVAAREGMSPLVALCRPQFGNLRLVCLKTFHVSSPYFQNGPSSPMSPAVIGVGHGSGLRQIQCDTESVAIGQARA
jgi:hypothetical protein